VFRDGAERPQLSIFERGASASREPLWSPSSLGAEAVDPLVSELRAFAAQVRLGSTAGNARRWIQAASLLQEGLHPGTEDEREDSLSAAPPDWRLIRGGRNDKAAPVIWERPDLRLLAAG